MREPPALDQGARRSPLLGWQAARSTVRSAHGQRHVRRGETSRSRPAVVPAKLRVPRCDGLRRERLLTLLTGVWSHRLCLLVAPAGCGKTTLIGHFAEASTVPVGWYRAEPGDGEPPAFLTHLEMSVRSALGEVDGPWLSAGDAALALEGAARTGLLLVIDDLHALGGTAAEPELERLVGYLPDGVAILAASRAQPRLNVSRLRVSGSLLEVGQDALRFRAWEVEQLFSEVYGEPLRPEELAELARRTGGWAAGLQLFHLATRGKAPGDRRRTLRELGSHSRLVREYLARNVLDELDAGTRTFLLRTSVLGRLNGRLCDSLLHRDGSGAVLAELRHRQLVTDLLDDDGGYRYHAVLRSHLETMAVEEMGELAVREQRRRAGVLLEAEAAFVEALEAYCSAGAWEEAARLLGVRGEELVAGPGRWIDLLPPGMEENPWVLLAAARRHLAAGRCRTAEEAYRRAETAFGDVATAELCRRERASLTAWTDVGARFSAGWSGLLRAATRRDPMAVSALSGQGPSPGDRLAAGLAALLAGRLGTARRLLLDLLGREDVTPAVGLCARLGAALTSSLGAAPDGDGEVRRVADGLEHAGFPWLNRLGRAVLAATGEQLSMVEPDGADVEDRWGQALRSLLTAWGEVRRGEGDPERLGRVVAAFVVLEASVLEAWARGLLALAQRQRGRPEAETAALRARAMADHLGVPGARALALAASADDRDRLTAVALADECGLGLPRLDVGDSPSTVSRGDTSEGPRPPSASPPSLAITCLGPFTMTLGGRLVELGGAKPKVRSLLRLLALHGGTPLHREVIAAALWPEADADTGTRNLQVAVSALRRLLESAVGPSGAQVLRDGEAYRLALPEDAVVDVAVYQRALAAGYQGRHAGDVDGAISAFQHALALASNELLPEEGPADWLTGPRERHLASLGEAALALATLHAERGDVAAAAAACERGLCVDRYSDPIWCLLIEIHRRAGNEAAGARVQGRYASVLRELGLVAR
jgi:DNA-binding SARP family transcriptional activator